VGAFFPVIRNTEIKVPEVVGAHVQPEEMAGGEAVLALENFEEVAGIDVFLPLVGVMLEELMAGFRMAPAADRPSQVPAERDCPSNYGTTITPTIETEIIPVTFEVPDDK